MSDGTRAHATRGMSWLDSLVPADIRARLIVSVDVGRAVVSLVSAWTELAGAAVDDFEAASRGRGIPDDVFDKIA